MFSGSKIERIGVFSVIARYAFGLPNTERIRARLVRENPKTPIFQRTLRRGIIIGNRTRPFAYTFRATEQERKMIDEKIKKSGLTMTEFVIRAITNKTVVDLPNGGEIMNELKRQGNNLNQAVKNIYYGASTEQELLNCIAELRRAYRTIEKAIGGM